MRGWWSSSGKDRFKQTADSRVYNGAKFLIKLPFDRFVRADEILGVRRWTVVLAYPAVFVFVPLIMYALTRQTFVWGGRRYRWRGKFDVIVVE